MNDPYVHQDGSRECRPLPEGMVAWHGGEAAPGDIGEAAEVLHADGSVGLANKRSILWGRPNAKVGCSYGLDLETAGPSIETRWIIAYRPEALEASTPADLTPPAREAGEVDPYEVANQLQGYIGPDTDAELIDFLSAQSRAAATMGDEITLARQQSSTPPAREAGEDEAYEIGKREGYSDAVQWIDERTGGDGEYRYCTVPDDRHCPGPVEMRERIVERFEALARQQSPARPAAEVGELREAVTRLCGLVRTTHGNVMQHGGANLGQHFTGVNLAADVVMAALHPPASNASGAAAEAVLAEALDWEYERAREGPSTPGFAVMSVINRLRAAIRARPQSGEKEA